VRTKTFAQSSPPIWTVPEIGALPTTPAAARCGAGALITATYAISVRRSRSSGALRLATTWPAANCHLNGGTKKFGIPLFGLFGKFSVYSARLGAEIRHPGAAQRLSHAQHEWPCDASDATQMQAMVAYIKFLSTGVRRDSSCPARGRCDARARPRLPIPVRAKACTTSTCAVCHGNQGEASAAACRRSSRLHGAAAGQRQLQRRRRHARLITAANFIHFNMPHGTTI